MSGYDFMKNKYSPVVDEVILERLDSSFSSSFSATFSNPFTTDPANTADLNSDKYHSRYHTPGLHPQWPKEPLSLTPTRSESILLMLYDVVMFLVPVLLTVKVALVIVAWHMDKNYFQNQVDQTSQLTFALIRINQQMVTAFTIVFTAIISTVLGRYALYKAQQGVCIGQLEQLHGSTSLLATLRMIWCLHSFGKTSVMLILIWSLYYLGSQASGLEYRLTDSNTFRTMIAAIPTAATPSVFNWPDPSTFAPLFSTIAEWNNMVIQLSTATLWYYVPEFAPGADIARRVLVPDLGFLTSSQLAATNTGPILEADEHGWYDVSKQSWIFDKTGYSSLAGWPVAVFNGTGNVTLPQLIDSLPRYLGDYTFSPTYINADCSAPMFNISSTVSNGTTPDQYVTLNMPAIDPDAPRDFNGHPQRRVEILAQVSFNSMTVLASAYCNVSQSSVVLQVQCRATGCFPRLMRWANGSAESSISFGTIFDDSSFATAILDYGAKAMNEALPLLLPQFNHDISWPSPISQVVNSLPELAKMQMSLSRGMTMSINTYYLLSLRWNYIQYTLDELVNHPADVNMTTTSFKGALYNPHYKVYWEWITIDLICSLVLLTAAIVSIALRMRTIVPDILGSVSSLTRTNPEFHFPDNGTSINGLERARLMKQIKVRLGDISSEDDEAGRIGLVRVDVGERSVRALSKITKYV